MDIFGIKALRRQNQQLLSSIQALQSQNRLSSIENIRTMIFPNWLSVKEIEAYIIFDDVYTVVSRLATSSAQVPWKCYNEATLEELPPNDPMCIYVRSLTQEDKEIMLLFLYLTGELFLNKDRFLFGPHKTKLKTIPMHPSFMSIDQGVVFPYPILGYRYQDTMTTFEMPPEEIIFTRYFNPTVRYDERHRGMSPIKALAQRLTRLQANMSASVSQMQNGGVPSIVFDKTPGIDQDRGSGGAALNNEATVMGQHKDNFSRFIRNSDNKGAPYFTAGEMGVIQLGLSLVELDALTQSGVDFGKICNAYSVSSLLFNEKDRGTYSNVSEMRKDMYTNAIIPNLTRVCNAITKGTRDVFGEGKCIKPDFSGVQELQEDMKNKAQAWASLPAFTINEMRISMGQDESTDPLADKLLVKTGYKFADDLGIEVEPIENDTNEYRKPDKANS